MLYEVITLARLRHGGRQLLQFPGIGVAVCQQGLRGLGHTLCQGPGYVQGKLGRHTRTGKKVRIGFGLMVILPVQVVLPFLLLQDIRNPA